MSRRKHGLSIIEPIATTAIWRWIVVPGSNPYIYIPAPTKPLAESIAATIDSGTCRPEVYVHRLLEPWMRTRLQLPLPPLPDLPTVPGFRRWEPVSEATMLVSAGAGTHATALVRLPGDDDRALFLIAAPLALHIKATSAA